MFFSFVAAAGEPAGIFDHFSRMMTRGGPLMWPILVCSVVALATALNRWHFFFHYRIQVKMGAETFRAMLDAVMAGKPKEALAAAEGVPSPQVSIFRAGLEAPPEGFSDAIQHEAVGQIQLMKKKMLLLDTVVTVAPMFGILGTVTGIISSFDLMGAMGVEDPTGVTAGIAEALLTTAFGLTASILALLPFNYFGAITRRNTRELEEFTRQMEAAMLTKPVAQPVVNPVEKK